MTFRTPLLLIAAAAGPATAQINPAPPAALAPPAAPTSGTRAGDIVVNMHDIEIAAVAEQISRLTGRTLILDPQVRGTVNVTSATPLSSDGVWELFQSVLRVHGFAAVRTGRAWRIVPQAEAVREAPGSSTGQQVTSRLVRLRNVSPETAARVFRPLVAQFGSIEPLTNPNAIVVTDYADNIARIERLAAALDGGRGPSFEAISLRLASAKDVGAALKTLWGEGDTAPRIAIDERSNILLVRGDARAVAEARRMADRMDLPGGATPTTRVFRLRNADAESVTAVLSGLLGGQTQSNNPIAQTLSGGSRFGSSINTLGSIGAGATGTGATNTLATGSNGSTLANAAAALTGSGSGSSSSGSLGSMAQSLGSSQSATSTGFSTPDLAVQSAPELNAIVVRGTPAALAQIQPLIDQLDVRRPQVMIEAAIVEVTADTAEALGVQFGLGNGLPGVDGAVSSFSNIGTPLTTILTTLGTPIGTLASASGFSGAISSGDTFQLLVQALGSSTKANLLSTPSVTTLDNQAAEIVVGQNVPFRTGSYTSQTGGTIAPFTTIERKDVGLTLRIIPRVHEGDVVRLDVSQEVSSLVGAVTGAADLITNRRAIQTTVLADDGQTIVLGGLISDDRTNTKSQVPVLGDIPILGNAFKSRQLQQTRRTLFVFLRPSILRDATAVANASAAKYARVRSAEAQLDDRSSLLLDPPKARLSVELSGVY
ncbi:type II secretion system secretin GspD [Sphingomonas sp. AP4-R1]|uniref:type II secretion system secretin GspD n=1 Tax=Sphingomonas sp. AP4-R1 TaxID=2735134 RepID=UPI001493D2E1|nr:type II secretion system secretin GspD [Sphingomonas sp. AP4-R1]QJU57666.1 type II secretion system secretin GspD [Sphingomonas sp. AP4-R1]